MINKQLAILMAGQKKQTTVPDPMVGKWVYVRFNETYANTAGFVIPKKIEADTYFFQTNSTYRYNTGTIQQMGGIKVSIQTKDGVQQNRILFCTNPYALASTYRVGTTGIGSSYVEIDDQAVKYFKSIGVYTDLYVSLTMTHVKSN